MKKHIIILKLKILKLKKNKIDFQQFENGKNLTTKKFKINYGEEKEIRIINYKINKNDELVIGIEPFKGFSSFNIKSNNPIYAVSLNINLHKKVDFRYDSLNLKLENKNGDKYILYNFLIKDNYEKIINTTNYENYMNLLITFPKPEKYFSINLESKRRNFNYFEIEEMTLYE